MGSSKISTNTKKLSTEKGYPFKKAARLVGLSLNTIMWIGSGINKDFTFETLMRTVKAWTSNLMT